MLGVPAEYALGQTCGERERYGGFAMMTTEPPCRCGHDWIFHDAHGCAAFLGGFAATAEQKRYCRCTQPSGARLGMPYETAWQAAEDVVAIVRVRQRPGTAIGVCEFPPALELGVSAEQVLAQVKSRLRAVVAEPGDGSQQWLLVLREDTAEMRVEALR
jgi:hypothetical protein